MPGKEGVSKRQRVKTTSPRSLRTSQVMPLELRIEMLLGRETEAQVRDEVQPAGTSSACVTFFGSKIETQPMPIPSARAASHRVWIAATTEVVKRLRHGLLAQPAAGVRPRRPRRRRDGQALP